jgi:RND family efflux transporter MFP subunit
MKRYISTLFVFLPATLLLLFIDTKLFAAESFKIEGITESYQDSVLSPITGGIVFDIKKKEGDFVKQGDVILELAHKEQSLAVQTLGLDYERNRKLYEKTKSVSTEELQKKELDFKLAQVELEKRIITAPFDGYITKIHRKLGEYSDPEQPLVRLVDPRTCRLIAHIDYSKALALKPGMVFPVIIQENRSPVRFEGRIEYISPVIDASSGLREIKVLFDNADLKIHPGITAFLILEGENGS